MTVLETAPRARNGHAYDDVDIVRDRDLVLRAQEGDQSAFAELYARYYRRLWRFCYKRLGDGHEAEDAVQEAFARAWSALSGFGGDRRFYPWLSVIAAHLCCNVTRKRNRSDPLSEPPDHDLASWEGCGEEHVMAGHDRAVAARAFARLSDRHRAVLELRETRGWSYLRIAEHQGVNVSTVQALLWRARQALKREFVLESEAGGLAGMVGALVFGLKRWLRAPRALGQQAGALGLTGPSALATATGAAVVALSLAAAVTLPGALARQGPTSLPARAAGGPPVTSASGGLASTSRAVEDESASTTTAVPAAPLVAPSTPVVIPPATLPAPPSLPPADTAVAIPALDTGNGTALAAVVGGPLPDSPAQAGVSSAPGGQGLVSSVDRAQG